MLRLGGGSFVFGVLAAVAEDVVVVEGLVDRCLIEFPDCAFASEGSTGTVVDAVATD